MPYKKGQKWVAQVRLNGRRREKVFPSKREALAWESAGRSNPEAIWPARTGTVSLFEWSQAYLDYAKAKFVRISYDEKRYTFARFFKVVEPELHVAELKPARVQAYLTAQKLERSGYAANKDRKNLLAAWNWGMKYMSPCLPAPNPCLVEKMPEVRSPRYVPPAEDFWKVYELAEGQNRVMLLACLHLAARRGEIFRLTWQDIDFGHNRVRLWTRKRRGGDLEYDWLPLTKALKQALLWWWENRPIKDQPHVFLCLDEKPFSREFYGQPFKYRLHFLETLCARAKVAKFGFHAIRHLTASTLYELGYEVAVIQAILRHMNPNTTERYLKTLGLESVRDALEDFSSRQGRVLEFVPLSATAGDRVLKKVKAV